MFDLTPLAAHPDEQPARAFEPRNSPSNQGGRSIPDGHAALMLVAARLRCVAGQNGARNGIC